MQWLVRRVLEATRQLSSPALEILAQDVPEGAKIGGGNEMLGEARFPQGIGIHGLDSGVLQYPLDNSGHRLPTQHFFNATHG